MWRCKALAHKFEEDREQHEHRDCVGNPFDDGVIFHSISTATCCIRMVRNVWDVLIEAMPSANSAAISLTLFSRYARNSGSQIPFLKTLVNSISVSAFVGFTKNTGTPSGVCISRKFCFLCA